MNMEFADGMRAAMRLIQAQKLMEATRVIQSALSGRGQTRPPAERRTPRARSKARSSISRRRS